MKTDYLNQLAIMEALVEEQPEEAGLLLQAIIGKIDEAKDPIPLAKAYFLLGETCYYADDLDGAILNYQKAAQINIRSGNDRTSGHINILGNLGYFYDTKDQKIIAADYYMQALKIAREIKDTAEIAANLANLGQYMVLSGNYEQALEYMEEALAIDRQLGDEAIIATDLNTIGRLYESWGMYDKAVGCLEEALEIDTRLGNTEKLSIRHNSLGLAYKGWEKFDLALEHFNEALQADLLTGNEEKVALRKANIGSTYMEMGMTGQAIAYLEESAAYFIPANLPSYSATVLNDLGRCYFQKQDYLKAEQSFINSIKLSREQGLDRFRLNSLEYLSRTYEAMGNLSGSLAVMHEFVVLKDALFNSETQSRMAEFNARFELDKKQKENELLRKDQEISRERQIIMALAFSLTGLFLFSVILALMIRLKMQQNRRLITQQENERLQSDLEQRNKELTYKAMCIIKNNETVAKIAETIEDAISSGNDQADLKHMVRKLQNMEREKNWTEFEVRFTQVHEDFYHKLNARFPALTPNEKKLCAFLRLNMTTKDIAAITHQSVHSIMVARTRLRKKLAIDGTDENLVKFLSQL